MLRSFTVLAVSACAALSASAADVNHDLRVPQTKDSRVFVTLMNKGIEFRDVKIGGHIYTIQPNKILTVKAPVGTVIYADSKWGKYHRGDTLVALTPSIDHTRISIY
jgi:hypothetical protein